MYRPLATSVVLGFAVLVGWPFARVSGQTSGEPARALGRTLLLVDDHDILYRSGTERVLHRPRKHPANPLVGEVKPWEVAIAWTSIYRDPATGKYQLWYQAHAGKVAQKKSHVTTVCYAESNDGITFDRPELDLHAFNDVPRTNIVLVGNGGHGDRYGASVLVEPQEKDPVRRYKMAYYDWSIQDGREYPGLHVAFSPDGVRWAKHPNGPLYRTSYGSRGVQPPLAGEPAYFEMASKDKKVVRKNWPVPLSLSDAVDVFYDAPRGVYAIVGKMWIGGPDGGLVWKHAMGRTESKDFLHWSKPRLLLTPDDRDPPDLEFHTSPVFYYGERYFCLNQILNRREGGTMNIELMVSRDGLTWERPFRDQFFLPRSEGNRFDSGSIFTNATPILLEDEIRFYYGAYGKGAVGGGNQIEGKEQLSGVGLATLPRDRFAGIRPVARSTQPTLKKPLEHVGQVTFKPLDLAGCTEILLNADAATGSIRAELLDEDGYRVRGFTADDAVPLRADGLRQPVTWKGGELRKLSRGRYSLRLHLHRAEVFAVSFR